MKLTEMDPQDLEQIARRTYTRSFAAIADVEAAWLYVRLTDGSLVTLHRSDVAWTRSEIA